MCRININPNCYDMENPKIFKKAKKIKLAILAILILLVAYVTAFIVVHRSGTLRKPAANMAYWYYSDNPVVENIEFYGFWPLRQICYHFFPEFEGRHNDERIYPDIKNEGM